MGLFAPHYLRKSGSIIGHLTPTWIGWIPYQPLRPLASEDTPMSLKTQSRYILQGASASNNDAECTTAPSRIPPWALLTEETQALFEGGHGTSPDLIYARRVPDTPAPGKTNFKNKACTLILIEIGFSRDLGCDKKHTEKTEKYSSLVAALKQYW